MPLVTTQQEMYSPVGSICKVPFARPFHVRIGWSTRGPSFALFVDSRGDADRPRAFVLARRQRQLPGWTCVRNAEEILPGYRMQRNASLRADYFFYRAPTQGGESDLHTVEVVQRAVSLGAGAPRRAGHLSS